MKRLIYVMTLLMALQASAQPRLPQNYYWQKMENGLEVLVIENNKVPLATIEIAVKNGAYTEGPEYSGLSHLFEHMFFKANKDYPDQEKFINRTNELGMIWNGTTGEERVNYFFTFNKDSLDAGLRFMNAAIRFPIYRKEDMVKENPVVDGEFQRAESNPQFLLWYEVQKRMWGELMTRKNPIGDHDVINTATPEKMMIIKDKYYHPNNSILVVCGDVQHDQVFAMTKRIFGDWIHSGFDPHQKYPVPEFKPLQATDHFIKESSIATTPFIMYEWQGPDMRNDSAATIAADVFNTILGLNASKWKQALVDKGLASLVESQYQTLKYVGPQLIYVLPNPDKMKECHEEILRQISMWGDADYFTDAQLEDAKGNLRRSFIRRKEKPSSLASEITYHWCSTSFEYYTDLDANYQKVSREDIARYINKYIKGKPYVAGLILNADANKKLQPSTYFKN